MGLSLSNPSLVYGKTPLQIVVTLKPIHALVSGLTAGITQPILLLQPGTSPHTFSLKPSQRQLIQKADLVIWLGPALEQVLIQTLADHPAEKVLALLPTLSEYTLPYRGHHTHDHSHEHVPHSVHEAQAIDPHVWLSTDLAQKMVVVLLEKFVILDPQHQEIYQTNAERLLNKLTELQKEMSATLEPYQDVNYLIYHDAYQYFEKEFNLKPGYVINPNPHLPMSAKRITILQSIIQEKKINCLCTEPEFGHKSLEALDPQHSIQQVTLDILGAYQPEGESGYFGMMRTLSQQLSQCLSK